MTKEIKPNLFIAGFPKSGTSSLHNMLIKHEDIMQGIQKEPHTYSSSQRFECRFEFFDTFYRNCDTRYILDSSTTYLLSKVAIKRIVSDTPNAKFIIIGRDPVDRIISHFNWLSRLGLVNKPFIDEFLNDLKKEFNFNNQYNGNFKNYLEASLYGEQLDFMLKHILRENLLFLEYETLFIDWENEKKKISDFLSIDLSSINIRKDNVTNQINTNSKRLQENAFSLLSKSKRSLYNIIKMINNKERNIPVFFPKNYFVRREDVEKTIIPFLKNDLKHFYSLGFNTKNWKTKDLLD